MSSAAPPAPLLGRAVGRRPESESPMAACLRRHPVLSFTVIAYALSWICWLPLLADRQGWVTWSASTYLHLLAGSDRPPRHSS